MSGFKPKYLATALALLIPLLCSGQAKVFTKKARIADFPAKTTKVVLSGDEMMDLSLRNEISCRWRISPYEFCSEEQYRKQKTDPKLYFLRLEKNKDGLYEMILSKGGDKGKFSNQNSALEVTRVPVSARYMSVMIDILQTCVEDSMSSEAKGILGLTSYSGTLRKARNLPLHVCREDVPEGFKKAGIKVVDEYFADSLLNSGARNALLAFTIKGEKASGKSSICYLVASIDTHELFWYRKRKYSTEDEAIFSEDDIQAIIKEHGGRKK